MVTLDNFKSELGVKVINFQKSAKTGREFTTVAGKNIIIAKNFEATKPAFVFFNEEKNVHVVCNSTLVAGRSL